MEDQSAGLVVIAPDKFKGSLTAPEVAERVAAGLHRFRPGLPVRLVPIADGGDGTLEAVAACGYELVPVRVAGPTGVPIEAAFGLRDDTAVVELAEASGLRRLPGGRLDPMGASSRGTGDLVLAALNLGCDEIIIGLGGSACTDGGAGMLQALGARLLDRHGRDIGPGGGALRSLERLDLSTLDPRLSRTRITLAGDVDNPLLGPRGAAAVYAPQKGATAAQVRDLDLALGHWAQVVGRVTGTAMSAVPGAGAAGGVAFAALSVLDAALRPGIELILDLINFEDLLPGANLVITGEGSLDRQSLNGKAPVGVAAAAARHGVPTVAVAGRSTLTDGELKAGRLIAAYALTSIEADPAVCVADAGRLLEELVATVLARDWLAPGP
jgi:glycerate 2-kinase